MIDIVVTRAILTPGPTGEGVWRLDVDITRDGETTTSLAVVPADAIEWRMAQFNVDAETAARMILIDRVATERDDPYNLQPTRSGARELKLARMEAALEGGTLSWVAPALAKGKGKPELDPTVVPEVIVDSEAGDPLATFVEHSPIDDDHIAVKREWMDRRRAGRRQRESRQQEATAERGRQRRTGADRPTVQRPTADELRERLIDRHRSRLADAESSGPADVRRERPES